MSLKVKFRRIYIDKLGAELKIFTKNRVYKL